MTLLHRASDHNYPRGVGGIGLEPGSVFAEDFRIEKSLAKGGFGEVFLVTQLSTEKQRALKVLHFGHMMNTKVLERFVAEARIGAKIESEHIVEVVAAGVDTKHDAPWLAMELLDGENLEELVKRSGPLAPATVAELYQQLGHALTAAHRAGILHLDLKPENLFLAKSRRYGGSSVLKVLDFGIARILQADRTAATATSVMGSPRWWAPEQCTTGTQLRASTDIWALGLIAFYLLTGKSYWKAGQPDSQGGFGGLIVEVLTENYDPPSQRAEALQCGPLPPGFDDWFSRCVAKEQAQRFSSVQEAVDRFVEAFGTRTERAPAPAAVALLGEPTRSSAPVGNQSTMSPSVGTSAAPIVRPSPPFALYAVGAILLLSFVVAGAVRSMSVTNAASPAPTPPAPIQPIAMLSSVTLTDASVTAATSTDASAVVDAETRRVSAAPTTTRSASEIPALPTGAALATARNKLRRILSQCAFGTAENSYVLRVTFLGATGAPSNVDLSNASSEFQRCVLTRVAVADVSVPRFRSPSTTVELQPFN